MYFRIALLVCLLVAPLSAEDVGPVRFFGSQEPPPAASQPEGLKELVRTDFANLTDALNALPTKWWSGPTTGPDWDSLVEKRLANKTLTYTGVFASRLALSAPETRVIFRGRLSPDKGNLLYEVVVDLPRDSPDPILKLPAKQGVILQGRIVSANFITYSEMSERRLCLKLDHVKHILITQPGGTAGQPSTLDAVRLAGENGRLKREVERLGALCRANGIDPRSVPPDPKKPTYGSVEEAINAMPRKFFEANQDRDLMRAYVRYTMGAKLVRVRGAATVEPRGQRTFRITENPRIKVLFTYPPGQDTPRAGDRVDTAIRITEIGVYRNMQVEGWPIKDVTVYGEVLSVDKPQGR